MKPIPGADLSAQPAQSGAKKHTSVCNLVAAVTWASGRNVHKVSRCFHAASSICIVLCIEHMCVSIFFRVYSPLQNFDPRNELVVANEQFFRVLSTQGLLTTSPRLRELLTRRYGVCDFRRQTTVHQVRMGCEFDIYSACDSSRVAYLRYLI